MESKAVKFFKSKGWDRFYFIYGFGITIISSIIAFMHEGQNMWLVLLTFIQTILGLSLVNFFANQKGKIGCYLGIPDTLLGAFNYCMNGSMGDMCVSIYSLVIYLRGLFFKKIDNKMNISKMKRKNLIVTICVCILGSIIIFCFSDKIIFKYHNAPFWILVLNVAIFLIAMVCQYLQVEGVFLAWPLRLLQVACSVTLYIWLITVQDSYATLIYLAKQSIYLMNNVKGIVIWADSLKSKRQAAEDHSSEPSLETSETVSEDSLVTK